ncbi:4774_t:CDS:1, partial [Diversispora eburnea]
IDKFLIQDYETSCDNVGNILVIVKEEIVHNSKSIMGGFSPQLFIIHPEESNMEITLISRTRKDAK